MDLSHDKFIEPQIVVAFTFIIPMFGAVLAHFITSYKCRNSQKRTSYYYKKKKYFDWSLGGGRWEVGGGRDVGRCVCVQVQAGQTGLSPSMVKVDEVMGFSHRLQQKQSRCHLALRATTALSVMGFSHLAQRQANMSSKSCLQQTLPSRSQNARFARGFLQAPSQTKQSSCQLVPRAKMVRSKMGFLQPAQVLVQRSLKHLLQTGSPLCMLKVESAICSLQWRHRKCSGCQVLPRAVITRLVMASLHLWHTQFFSSLIFTYSLSLCLFFLLSINDSFSLYFLESFLFQPHRSLTENEPKTGNRYDGCAIVCVRIYRFFLKILILFLRIYVFRYIYIVIIYIEIRKRKQKTC